MSEKPMTVGELNDAIEAMGLEREDCACCALQGLYNTVITLRKENEELNRRLAEAELMLRASKSERTILKTKNEELKVERDETTTYWGEQAEKWNDKINRLKARVRELKGEVELLTVVNEQLQTERYKELCESAEVKKLINERDALMDRSDSIIARMAINQRDHYRKALEEIDIENRREGSTGWDLHQKVCDVMEREGIATEAIGGGEQ